MCRHEWPRTPDGIVIIDTCPSKEVFDEFTVSEGFQALMAMQQWADNAAAVARHVSDEPDAFFDAIVDWLHRRSLA